jgi:nucleoside-diphosphate-sugar epimerase
MNKSVIVSGASGYLGKAISQHLVSAGYEVYSLGRSKPDFPGIAKHVTWSLEHPSLPADTRADTFIHCAWNMAETNPRRNEEINLNGTQETFQQAIKNGAKIFIFISTTSAFIGSKTHYGKSKYLLEQWLKARGALVVRPGLLWGNPNGSMMAALEKITMALPVIPVFGAQQPFFLTEVSSLAEAVVSLIKDPSLYDENHPVLASSDSVPFLEILKNLARRNGKKRLFFPVPWRPVYFGLRFMEKLNLNLPFKSDSLLSLMTLPLNLPINKSFFFPPYL